MPVPRPWRPGDVVGIDRAYDLCVGPVIRFVTALGSLLTEAPRHGLVHRLDAGNEAVRSVGSTVAFLVLEREALELPYVTRLQAICILELVLICNQNPYVPAKHG